MQYFTDMVKPWSLSGWMCNWKKTDYHNYYENEVIMLLTSASDLPIKDTGSSRTVLYISVTMESYVMCIKA